MKTLYIIALFCLAGFPACAQKIIEKTLPYNSKQRVRLDFKFADKIQIKAWDKPEVAVKISVTVNNGRLNDALRADFASRPEEISVKTDFDEELIRQGRPEDCPDKQASRYNWDGKDGAYVCSDIYYEVYVPRQADVQVETINGNVEITDFTGPLFAKSISGFVDVSWPKNKGADVAMQSITGEVYSDLAINFQNKQEQPATVGYLLKGQVNGGGPRVRLESISNNIYLRAR